MVLLEGEWFYKETTIFNLSIMKLNQNIKLAVDAVVFGYKNDQIYVLLIQQKFGTNKNKWALPGGFILDNETLTEAVERELKEETGVKVNYLEQLYTFGDDINRDSRFRVVSVAYFALVNPHNFNIKADTDAEHVEWVELNKIPKLAFDHNDIVNKAIERLRAKLSYQPIGFELLDEKFPFSHLEHLYQTILGKEIDRRNFRKKIMSFGFVEETKNTQQIGAGRPAKLFQFNKKKYKEIEQKGFHFEIK